MDGESTTYEAHVPPSHGSYGVDYAAITLALRGERYPLRNATASCFNQANRHLLVASRNTLCLFGDLLELGGTLIAQHHAQANTVFHRVLVLPWINAYGVIVQTEGGRLEHNYLSADLAHGSTTCTHVVASSGRILSIISNPDRRELITSDSNGGFKVWLLRASGRDEAFECKGFQRVHAGSHKTVYNRLELTRDSRTILACSRRSIHAFDATTCARIGTFYKEAGASIHQNTSTFDRYMQAMYIQRHEQACSIYKLQATTVRGNRMQKLQPAGEYVHEDAVVAVQAIERGFSNPATRAYPPVFDGFALLDVGGNLTVASCNPLEADAQTSRPRINLQFAPSTQEYVELHADTSADSTRNFVVVVGSSGMYIVELFLPITSIATNAWTRRLVTNVVGSKLSRIEARDWKRVAILYRDPPSLLLLQHEILDDFYAMGLEHVASHEAPHVIVDTCAVPSGLVTAWSCGDITHVDLTTERTTQMCSIDTTPTVLYSITDAQGGPPLVFVGDGQGVVRMWEIDQDANATLLCSKTLHRNKLVSILHAQDSSKLYQYQSKPLTLVSATEDGEVKAWTVRLEPNARTCNEADVNRVNWDLVVCFRNYGQSISSCALMGTEFFFAGSKDGGFECWRLPPPATPQQISRSHRNVVVVKKALHSIDLHLTRVCQVVVESGDAAKRVVSSPPHLDEFAWVVTYDTDGIVFIWCVSMTFMFPHRRLRLHAPPTGTFLECGGGRYHLMGYVGRCLECLDVLTDQDKQAVLNRLAIARAANDVDVRANSSTHTKITCAQEGLARSPEALRDSSNSVRLCITLPTVDHIEALHEIEVARPPSPNRLSPARQNDCVHGEDPLPFQNAGDKVKENSDSPDPVEDASVSAESDTRTEASICIDVPTARARTQAKPVKRRPSQQRISSSYAPETLPSQFSSARPRTYKSSRAAPHSSQSRCAVVTAALPMESTYPVASIPPPIFETTEYTHHQDKIAIVSLTDTSGDKQLRLDFGGSSRQCRLGASDADPTQPGGARKPTATFLAWSSLPGDHQSIELMAASRSKGVVEAAQAENIAVPTLAEFTSIDVKAQLKVRAYSRWYLANQLGRQRIREMFLVEELQFAARDGHVQMELKRAGHTCPQPSTDINSSDWVDFAMWYATGRPGSTAASTIAASVVMERVSERTAFLKRRLDALREVEEGEAASTQPVFLFDELPALLAMDAADSPSAWSALSDASRILEIGMAIVDPEVQLAAMLDDVVLPDLQVGAVNGADVLNLATAFVLWWSAPISFQRTEFLKREVKAAMVDASVHSILEQEHVTTLRASEKEFAKAYFRSVVARQVFVENQRRQQLRASRIKNVVLYGKLPAPILVETLPVPGLAPFAFPVPPPVVIRKIRDPSMRHLVSHADDEQVEDDDDNLPQVVEEDTGSREQGECEHMGIEDALSRELNDAYGAISDDDDPEEVDQLPRSPPKRTDFTASYFFGNLPRKFRINAGGWLAGSGIDNGDEGLEEEEQLARERQRQEMLDRLEAERIADVERQAEKARQDKEREEKAMQLRRLHQIELKKILAHQLELEQKRAAQIEHENRMATLAAMAREEKAMREWLAFLELERRRMIAEDKRATAIRNAKREAKVADMRRVLAELTLMDAEDRRSTAAQAEQLERECHDRLRVAYLTDLYEPFEPYFPSSAVPCESYLPSLQRKTQLRLKSKHNKARQSYAMPFAEALTIEEVECEAYAVRDTRKLRKLLGLPVGSPQSRHGMRIPSEREILKSRKQLQLMLPPTHIEESDEERGEEAPRRGRSSITMPRTSNQADCSTLPTLARRSAMNVDDHFTDLAHSDALERSGNLSPHKSKSSTGSKYKRKQTKSSSVDAARQQTALPFFRGNFGVRGEGKSRPSDGAAR